MVLVRYPAPSPVAERPSAQMTIASAVCADERVPARRGAVTETCANDAAGTRRGAAPLLRRADSRRPVTAFSGRAVVKLRWPIALAWIAPAALTTALLPSIDESQNGALGVSRFRLRLSEGAVPRAAAERAASWSARSWLGRRGRGGEIPAERGAEETPTEVTSPDLSAVGPEGGRATARRPRRAGRGQAATGPGRSAARSSRRPRCPSAHAPRSRRGSRRRRRRRRASGQAPTSSG
jgi:hypothetical protein